MAEVIRASWEDLRDTVTSARQELIVCTPYFSEVGVSRLFDHIQGTARLLFITRLSPSDWLQGVSDPNILVTLFELLTEASREAQLIIHQRLHAKAYIADNSRGLLGSANLSSGGFERNFELMVRIQGEEVANARALIGDEVAQNGHPLSVPSLRLWVDQHEARVTEMRPLEDSEAEGLADMQRDLDAMLGFGGERPQTTRSRPPEIEPFVGWLEQHQNLAGSEVLLDRHRNTSGQNLTGHFRQSYFGASNFLLEHQNLIPALSRGLDSLGPPDVFQPDIDLLDAWIRYLDLHAIDRGESFDYAVLRGILPPNLGGTRLGGGGGSSTFKRILPLVARFLDENGV